MSVFLISKLAIVKQKLEMEIFMSKDSLSTIAAISTPPGKGGIAVLRVSGDMAVEICSKIFLPKGTTLSDIAPNTAVYGDIYYGGEKIDDGIATVFRAPRSYTGEDTVEISCHGSIVGASLVLSALLENGAFPAQAGEFTKRAFLSGKLSLSQAEAVGELIDAESVASARLSASKLGNAFDKKINSYAEKITNILSSVYAYIDYPDEDIADMSSRQMQEKCEELLSDIKTLSATYDIGKAILKGVSSVIVGSPNVGKSSFLNFLLNEERAIVTDIAGTTRDVISESVNIGNIKLLLCDTAGIRETQDTVEKIGVERSRKALAEAELVFALFDTSRKKNEQDEEIIKLLSENMSDKKILFILNKSDIDGFSDEYIKEAEKLGIEHIIKLSAKEGVGTENIEKALSKLYPGGDELLRSGLAVTSARQYASLKNAQSYIENSLQALGSLTPDMCCAELEGALRCLLEIDGRSVNEKIIEGIFAHFCVGK